MLLSALSLLWLLHSLYHHHHHHRHITLITISTLTWHPQSTFSIPQARLTPSLCRSLSPPPRWVKPRPLPPLTFSSLSLTKLILLHIPNPHAFPTPISMQHHSCLVGQTKKWYLRVHGQSRPLCSFPRQIHCHCLYYCGNNQSYQWITTGAGLVGQRYVNTLTVFYSTLSY